MLSVTCFLLLCYLLMEFSMKGQDQPTRPLLWKKICFTWSETNFKANMFILSIFKPPPTLLVPPPPPFPLKVHSKIWNQWWVVDQMVVNGGWQKEADGAEGGWSFFFSFFIMENQVIGDQPTHPFKINANNPSNNRTMILPVSFKKKTESKSYPTFLIPKKKIFR